MREGGGESNHIQEFAGNNQVTKKKNEVDWPVRGRPVRSPPCTARCPGTPLPSLSRAKKTRCAAKSSLK